ncbi:MAG: RNA-binding transcriptional accessory protein [Sandaracinaceae bacterium]|nr:MAG: RNA-binding transcriptional accessory protein [Sandaracinaceae bacterium]
MSQPLTASVANALSLPDAGVAAVLALLDEGATVPFIARYRKERTGGLDEVQIRAIQERQGTLKALADRKQTVLSAIEEQGALTPALRRAIEACETKTALEDLYAPFKKKRKTRGSMARDKGLGPLADRILAQPRDGSPKRDAQPFVTGEVKDVEDALAGARDIVAETVADDPRVRGLVRETFLSHGRIQTKAARGKKKERSKFEQYYDFAERIERMPSHRVLAILRGESEGFLRWSVDLDHDRLVGQVERVVGVQPGSPFAGQLREAVKDGYARLLTPSLTNDVKSTLKEKADGEAIEVFADNLRDLLLAAPLGEVPVLAIDPGIRTGCKCAALDATGRYLEDDVIYPDRRRDDAARALVKLVKKHGARAVAVGNGTAGRETEAFAREALKDAGLDAMVVSVSESGASIYSASDVAREEFPDLDLTVRGAISIGRRLQDPLAELVKLDPKAIGVGQYQHDVDQKRLAQKLDEVVESCVNQVGVALNLASAALLSHVAGLGPSLAKRVVEHRESAGRFTRRRELLKVKGLGPKAFEQCAGFLRIQGGREPLDASAVHPERYPLVQRMAKDLGVSVDALVGDAARARSLDLSRYVEGDVGLPTLRDIVAELEKPGRDPREAFEPPRFRDDVREMEDLKAGMQLEGVVTNVTHFGAFVDVGVHQDGLVHVSQLADRYVSDPREVVKVGDRVQVRVLEVDLQRKRISLSRKQLG